MTRLATIVSRIERHISKSGEISKRDLSDQIVFDALAMECFQAVNSTIELGEFIVSMKNIGFPGTYKEIFELLYKEKIIDKHSLDIIKRLIFLRNVISHEYYAITEKELREMAELVGALDQLTKKAKKL